VLCGSVFIVKIKKPKNQKCFSGDIRRRVNWVISTVGKPEVGTVICDIQLPIDSFIIIKSVYYTYVASVKLDKGDLSTLDLKSLKLDNNEINI